MSQLGEGSREEGEEWVMGILRDPTGSLGSGASWLPQAAPGGVWWAADAIYVKGPRPLRWGQDGEAAVVVVGKLCGMRGQWSKPELSFCQDLPSQKRQQQHLSHPPLLPGRRVAAGAKELKRVLLAPDRRRYNLGSQTKEEKGMRKCPMRLWSSTEGRKEKKKEFENRWIIILW